MLKRILFLTAIAAAIVFAVPAIRHWRERPPEPPPPPQPIRSHWSPPDGLATGSGSDYPFGLSLARDGRQLVFPAAKNGVVSLWLHDLRNGETRELPGTDGAAMPFWSPDASRIGFFAHGKIRALELSSGQATDLADAPGGRGAAWNSRGDLIFSPAPNSGLMLRDGSGSITPFTTLDGDTSHAWPAFVDDTHLIFLAAATSTRSGIWITPLDDPK